MKKSLVTIVLAGGTGSRMGSNDRHKVCFEVAGRPVILRALETYTLCGSALNVVVVGALADHVMATIGGRFPGTAYAFQPKPLGTGDAARHGASLLERIGYDGDVLVVAGDKLIEPVVIRRMLARHRRSNAAMTVATVRAAAAQGGGLVIETGNRIADIVETWEVRRLLALAEINRAFAENTESLPAERIRQLVLTHLPERKAADYLPAIWSLAQRQAPLPRDEFLARHDRPERDGILASAGRSTSAADIEATCRRANLSTYLFRADALYKGLAGLAPEREDQETYLTDVVKRLASQEPKAAKIVGYDIGDPRGVMAFNNPQELLEVNAYYRRGTETECVSPGKRNKPATATAAQWLALFEKPSAAARKHFRRWYGDDIPWQAYRRAAAAFAERFGAGRPFAIVRSPGRINLMGRHIDHQGGSVNVMAINREVLLAAAANEDGTVRLTNTDDAFPDHTFRVPDLIARLDWDDWQQAVDGPRIERLLANARGRWSNYFQAALLRLQEGFRDRCLRGMDGVVHGTIPMGAGLSSSSALVVAAAEAAALFNGLAVTARRLVSLCGEGEWFVGTRGGAADHAAIKLSRRGYVTRVGFFPFRMEQAAPFFDDHDLLVCNSGIHAGKSNRVRNQFNAKVTAYHLGRIYLRLLRPDLAPRIEHLRDVEARRLGLTRGGLYRLLAGLPAALTRAEARRVFAQIPESEQEAVESLFTTHDEPRGGYTVRGVAVFGLAEMARARRCLDLLERGKPQKMGLLMNISHDGDCVTRRAGPDHWKRSTPGVRKTDLLSLAERRGNKAALHFIPGAYGCSLPQLDRLADTLRELPGVRGAQMAGAGLGGCVMALVHKDSNAAARQAAAALGAPAELYKPIAGACIVPFE